MSDATQIERNVAAPVCDYLRDMGWDVYEEVCAIAGRADIVGVKGRLVWVIEAKARMCLQLLGQTKRWLPYAHFVSVVVQGQKYGHQRNDGDVFADGALEGMGAGKFEYKFHPLASWEECLREKIKPEFRRKVDASLILSRLHEKQKTVGLAGSRGGGYYTPFRGTCDALLDYVKHHNGCSLKSAIDSIKHHYRSPGTAVNCMRSYIDKGIVKCIRNEGGKLFFEDE
jgi:hypothetical protein